MDQLQIKESNTIFIFSQHRTGSTLLKNMLDANDDVSMAFDEMNIFEPLRKNTLDKVLRRKEISGNKLIELIKKKKIYGTFWKEFEKSKINYGRLEENFNSINEEKLTPLLIFILDEIKKINGTKFSGVKYPTHISKMKFIFNAFKDSKNIFLTRNPLAIVGSKINDPATQKRIKKLSVFGFVIRYFTLFYVCIEYIYSFIIYNRNKKNLKIIFYEELVLNKEKTIREICDFLGLIFCQNMLNVTGKSSSYKKKKIGFKKNTIDRYKMELKPIEIKIVTLMTYSCYKRFLNELPTNI